MPSVGRMLAAWEPGMRPLQKIALFSTLVLSLAVAAQGEKSADEAAVRATVDTYLHGLKFNDVASFRAVFLPEAKLYFIRRDGAMGSLTQEDWYKGFATSAGKEEQGTLSIAAVDVTGNAASVKVREEYPTSTYTDYISLLKIGDAWKIVNKIFFAESKPK
jgi:hypothetical protein